MTDEHDRISNLLREQGQAEAPPDLAADVMAQVRREPQAVSTHRGVNWRPVAAWAAVAAALLAVGVGIAQLAPTGSTSSSGSAGGAASSVAAEAAGGSEALPSNTPAPVEDSARRAFTIPRHEAEKLLSGTKEQFSMVGASTLTLDRARWDALKGKLAALAARHPHPKDPVIVRLRPD